MLLQTVTTGYDGQYNKFQVKYQSWNGTYICTRFILKFCPDWPHTVILPDWTFKKWGFSIFAFQSFYGFIGTLNEKIF